jgi:biotin carboxyl carrier protein
MLRGQKFPGKAFLLTFVEACNVDLENDRRWERTWDRLAPQYLGQGELAGAEQLTTALAEVEQLRQRLEELEKHEPGAADARQLLQQLAAANTRADQAAREAGKLRKQLVETEEEFREELAAAKEESDGLRRQLADRKPSEQRVLDAEDRANRAEGRATLFFKSMEQVEAEAEGLRQRLKQIGAEHRVETDRLRRQIKEAKIQTPQSASGNEAVANSPSTKVSVRMPQLGESVPEGTVMRWLKKEGERVEADEPLLEVSTDKVDTEIPSPAAGVLRGIAVDENETVEVGTLLAVIDQEQAAPPKRAG